jgi:hypothetical protein
VTNVVDLDEEHAEEFAGILVVAPLELAEAT